MFNKLYDNIQSNIDDVSKKVDALNEKIIGASKDAGTVQVLLNEAPELRKNIQETHDATISHTARLDSIDRNVAALSASLDAMSGTYISVEQQMQELNRRIQPAANQRKEGK